MIYLLQIADSTAQAVNTVLQGDLNNDGQLGFWEILVMGGWVMIPLAILLMATIFVFSERTIAIRHAARIDGNFMNIIKDHIVSGNVAAARSFAKNTNNPVARIIHKGIQRIGKPIDSIDTSMESVAQQEMFKLEKNLNVLSVISRAAPIFGFIGTLSGLMQLFFRINSTNELEIGSIAGGIYTKLVTSISGLIIGLLAYLGYTFLQTQIDKTTNKMEVASADFLDILQEPTK